MYPRGALRSSVAPRHALSVPIRIDDARHPLVVVNFVGTATDAEFDAYLDDMQRLVLDRREKNVTILDATLSGDTPPTQRRKQADWLKRNAAYLREFSLGTAFVIDSPFVRGVLTAIFWITPMSAPYTIVATYAEAEAWATRQLQDAGLAPSGKRRTP